jgi:hypothetical protein
MMRNWRDKVLWRWRKARELRRQAKYALQDRRAAEELHRVEEGAQRFPFTAGGGPVP